MDWLIKNSLKTVGINRNRRAITSAGERCDPTACYDSFKEHWQQVLQIIQRNQQLPSHDDVLGVVSYLEQMVSLLVYDLKDENPISPASPSPCLEYLLNEQLLRKLYEWSEKAGKYTNAVRLEQLKLFETLVTHSRHMLLVHEPFLQSLLKLLSSWKFDALPNEIEKSLVGLIYQLCVVLMQNADLVDLFIVKNEAKPNFMLFKLLMQYVHRHDSIGMQARDALLLCMSLSKMKSCIAEIILQCSDMCILLACGLGSLYSILPPVLTDITAPDWHRLTPDDVKDIKDLSAFITSLEFSNAVARLSHPNISKELQEFMHKGFLIPVLGPALLQSNIGEQITAMAYLELILRTVTQPGLLYPLMQFLLQSEYDGQRLLHILINRLNSEPQLTLVTLALFESLIDINCEDIMLELVFQYLQPCLHLMLSQRCAALPLDTQCQNFERLLALAPSCCDTASTSPRLDGRPVHWNHYGSQMSLYGNYHAYLFDARNKINLCQMACSTWSNSYTGCERNNTSLDANSLGSLGDSSGYESLKVKLEKCNESNLPVWQVSDNEPNKREQNGNIVDDPKELAAAGSVGLFITVLLDKLKLLLNNTFYVNLHLTGLISRLAVYPQPLLRTYLLDHSLILQPNVPSLFQIIGSLKNTIDTYMLQQADRITLIEQAKLFLVDRETRLVNLRRNTIEKMSTSLPIEIPVDNDNAFQRNGPKRGSLRSFTAMFNRRPSEPSIPMTVQQEDTESLIYPKFQEAQHVAVCAVLLDEWVKELAALAQEHAITQLTVLYK